MPQVCHDARGKELDLGVDLFQPGACHGKGRYRNAAAARMNVGPGVGGRSPGEDVSIVHREGYRIHREGGHVLQSGSHPGRAWYWGRPPAERQNLAGNWKVRLAVGIQRIRPMTQTSPTS